MAFVTAVVDSTLCNCVKSNPANEITEHAGRKWVFENFDRIDDIMAEAKTKKENAIRKGIEAKNKYLRGLVKHVHWSGNTCIVYWNDGTQTKAHWDPCEEFDPEKAILVCMARKLYLDSNIYNEVIQKYEDDGWDHYEKEFLYNDKWYD